MNILPLLFAPVTKSGFLAVPLLPRLSNRMLRSGLRLVMCSGIRQLRQDR